MDAPGRSVCDTATLSATYPEILQGDNGTWLYEGVPEPNPQLKEYPHGMHLLANNCRNTHDDQK